MVSGRVRMRGAAPQFWLWTIVIFVAFGIVYWNISERQLQTSKSEVMARQRAIKQELEPRIVPLRDKVEAWVMELAGQWQGEFVETTLSVPALSDSKGIYLRLLARQAHTPEDIRNGMQSSLHDGFTSCLFKREEHFQQGGRKACHTIAQCPAGEICNDWNLCAPPSQPFNLRLMYRGLRVLSPSWSDELHQASDDYQVRVFSRDLDKASKDDVPLAIQLVTQAKYFTAVLDEEPKQGLPAGPTGADAGLNREELRVQLVDHPVRIGIWELKSGRPLLRMRTQAGADVIAIGRSHVAEQRIMDAQQRQVNNCGIALDVKERIDAVSVPAPTAPIDAPASAQTADTP